MAEGKDVINTSEEIYNIINTSKPSIIFNLIRQGKINSDNVNNIVKDNKTLLELAFENSLFLSVKELLDIENTDTTKIKEELIENALMYVYKNYDTELLNVLVESFGKEKIETILQKSDKKFYFLYYTIQHEEIEIFRETINIIANALTEQEIQYLINNPDDKGMTLFMYACQIGNKDMIQILFNLGVNLELVDKRGFNALDIFELFNFGIYDYENDDFYKAIKQIFNKDNIKDNNTQLNKELISKLYCISRDKFYSLKYTTFKLRQFGADLNFFKYLIIEYHKHKKNPEQQALISRTVFCNTSDLEKTIHELQQKIGDSNEVYYIRLDDKTHNCSIAVSKDTIFGMDSSVSWFGDILSNIKLNDNTKLFAIGDYMQTDNRSCGMFSLETVLALDVYLKTNNKSLRLFVEETSLKKENFRNKKNPARVIDNCIMIPIPNIFAHLVQRSLETLNQMFENELNKNLIVDIVDKIDSPRIKMTQQQLINSNSIELDDGKLTNNYMNKNREIVVRNLINETKYISREEFDQKIENYKNNKIKLDNVEKNVNKFKMFLGYSYEFDILIEQNKQGKTQIFATKAIEKHTNPFINKIKRNVIICEKTKNNELIFKFSDKYINKYNNISNILKSIKLSNIDTNNDIIGKIYEDFINKNGIMKFIEQYVEKTELNETQKNQLIEFDKKLIERFQNYI